MKVFEKPEFVSGDSEDFVLFCQFSFSREKVRHLLFRLGGLVGKGEMRSSDKIIARK